MSAVDKDGSEFNALTYSFQSGEKVTELFTLDETTGLLTTRQPLDREVKDIFTRHRTDPFHREVKGAERLVSSPVTRSKRQGRLQWTVKLKAYAHLCSHFFSNFSRFKIRASVFRLTAGP